MYAFCYVDETAGWHVRHVVRVVVLSQSSSKNTGLWNFVISVINKPNVKQYDGVFVDTFSPVYA